MLALDPKAPLATSVEVNTGAPAPLGIGQEHIVDFVSQPIWFDKLIKNLPGSWTPLLPGNRVLELNKVDRFSALPTYTEFRDVMVATGFLQRESLDGFKFLRKLRIVYPAAPSDPTKLSGSGRLPVVVLVHGQHAFLDGSYHVPNHIGYTYLQQELALRGIVSVGVDTNVANFLDCWIEMRALMVLAALDQLRALDTGTAPKSRYFGRLDLDNNVGIMGHSRGGDAVVRAAILNHDESRGYGIRAVCALAPTDYTGTAQSPYRLIPQHTSFLAVIYGTLDGDVSTGDALADIGSGFRHYDRATTRKAMVFLNGCNHNRFNDTWADDDALMLKSDVALLRSRNDHRQLAKEYIGGLFEWWLLGKTTPASLFDGTTPNTLGVPAAIQWSFGTALDEMESSGPVSGTRVPGAVLEVMADVIGTNSSKVGERTNHQTEVLVLPSNATQPKRAYQLNVAVSDWSKYDLFTFRACADADVSSPTSINNSPLPEFTLVFKDSQGGSAPVTAASLWSSTKLKRPVFHQRYSDPKLTTVMDCTVISFQTLSVELSKLAGVKLTKMASVEVTLPVGYGVKQFLDSFRLVKR